MAMVLLVVTPKLGVTLSMYVVYSLAIYCWLFTRCLRGNI